MACVTLKRPLDHTFEPLQNASPAHRPPPSKRRRCLPFRELSRDAFESSSTLPAAAGASSSSFREIPLKAGDIASHLRDELKRLRRRRQLPDAPHSPGAPEPMDDASAVQRAVAALAAMSSPAAACAAATVRDNKPLFTLRQMTLICEGMCKERTEAVRGEYERILQQKLSEQYDAFVRFIDHQIEQRFTAAQLPSYVS